MTLVEFLEPLAKSKHQDRILAVLYFCERYDNTPTMSIEEIRKKLRTARVKGAQKVNIADVLNKCGALADTDGVVKGKRVWKLTDSGNQYVRKLLALPDSDPEVEHDIGTLNSLVSVVANDDVREYLREALKCLQVGALRACVVFIWTATTRTIQNELLSFGSAAVTAAIKTHDPKTRTISKLDDFAYVKEAVLLLAAKDLGLYDKNEKDALTEALNLRNRCGHPTKYKPGLKKVSAFVEDVTSIVY